MFEIIGAAFGAIKEFFGFANKKLELNNTPEMIARAKAQKELDQTDKDENDIKNQNKKAAEDALS